MEAEIQSLNRVLITLMHIRFCPQDFVLNTLIIERLSHDAGLWVSEWWRNFQTTKSREKPEKLNLLFHDQPNPNPMNSSAFDEKAVIEGGVQSTLQPKTISWKRIMITPNKLVIGKLASLNREWQSSNDTFRLSGKAGNESTDSTQWRQSFESEWPDPAFALSTGSNSAD